MDYSALGSLLGPPILGKYHFPRLFFPISLAGKAKPSKNPKPHFADHSLKDRRTGMSPAYNSIKQAIRPSRLLQKTSQPCIGLLQNQMMIEHLYQNIHKPSMNYKPHNLIKPQDPNHRPRVYRHNMYMYP